MLLSSGFFGSPLKVTAAVLTFGLSLSSAKLLAAPDLGSRNAITLSQDIVLREMEGATATAGIWTASGGRRLYDGSGDVRDLPPGC